MKHIKIGLLLMGFCLFFSLGAAGQTESTGVDSLLSFSNDSLVHVAYRSVNKIDLPNATAVLNPSEYLDKFYGTYALAGVDAFVGGSNLWNLGGALVLVDGVPREVGNLITNEIEQITFLKGANAVVLYGSRAANGVILITTKRGETIERRSNVYANTGIHVPKSYPEFLNAAEYMTYYNQARVNDGLTEQYDAETISNYESHSNTYRYSDVDYYSSEYLRTMFNTYDINADFSGATDRARFYAIAGYYRQNSLLNFGEGENERGSRFNIRGNIDLKLNDYITTYINVSNIFYDLRTANTDYWDQAATIQPHRFSPLVPIDLIDKNNETAQTLVDNSRHVINGNFLLGGNQEYLTNPISDVYAAGHNTYTSRQLQYTGGLVIDLSGVTKGLSFHGQVAIDYSNTYMQSVDNTYAVYVPTWVTTETTDSISAITKFNEDKNNGTQNLSETFNNQVIDFNFHFDYVNTFQEKHNLSAIILAAGLRTRETGDFQYGTNTNLGVQLAYNYAHRYYADFSGAVVSSTKLPENSRVAFSPTLGLGWLLSEENFLKGSAAINRLKLTASAGIINTDMDIDDYFLYNAQYSKTAYFSWADATYVNQATTISRGENLNLTYSKRKEVNIGVGGTLFSRLLDFQTNIFLIRKEGMPVQSYTQYPSFFFTYWPETSFVPYVNYEENSYKGFDFQLDYNDKLANVDFTLGVSGTYVKSEALVRDENYADTYRNRAGNPTDAIFGLESEGLFMNQDEIDDHAEQRFGEVKPGDIKYKDQNNDGVIDERDEVMIGHWRSPLSGGVHLTAEWKNFTLFALGTGYFGGTAVKNDSYYWVFGSDSKYSEVVRDSWTEETRNTATYPRLTTLSGGNNFRTSDFWIYSTNRFNLSHVQLTYSFPMKIQGRSPIEHVNVYVSGSNLLTISENKEILELNVGTSPQTRIYTVGIKAVF
jgi:TonB-linked SusC/RagA family outer membrane protein